MELREFARRVLLSADLDQKLAAPGALTDRQPGPALADHVSPGRPPSLPLHSQRPTPRAPTPAKLVHADVRGQALHTFAHHELQAAELMAMALLRFPNAPALMRMGLAHIIQDEQRHFRLYQARAESCGVGIGDVGAGHFFWDTVVDLPTPARFLAALSLTYEQANLDFAMYWSRAFAAIEDSDTVAALDVVYRDEIRHVQHGLRWFEHLTGPITADSYQAQLRFPLSPGRAKGPIFDREGRVSVGFPTHFIDEIELRSVSRGRPPRVFSFDPFVEERVAGRSVPKSVGRIQADLASLPMFLAHKEDVVLAPRPATSILLPLHRGGFPIPEFQPTLAGLGDRAVGAVQSWGVGPGDSSWDESHTALFDKTWAHDQRRLWAAGVSSPLMEPERGQVCQSLEQVRASLAAGRWVAKAPTSSSGQHRRLLTAELSPSDLAWLESWLGHGPLLVEPWVNRLLDLSTQVVVGPQGVKVLGLTRFWTSARGAYRGSVVGAWSSGLQASLLRQIHQGGVGTLLKSAALHVGEAAHDLGYVGPLGVDAMAYSTDLGLRLNPLLEVNSRYTMGRIALAIRGRCGGTGRWAMLSQRDVVKAPCGSLEELARRVRGRSVEVSDGRLRRGSMFTTEPSETAGRITLLCVAPTWTQATGDWVELGLGGLLGA